LGLLALEADGNTFLRNVANHSPSGTASHRRILEFSAAPLSQTTTTFSFQIHSENFSSLNTSRSTLRPTQPPPGLFSGVKRPAHVVDHWPPSRAEAKNDWSYTSTPPQCFHGIYGTNLPLTIHDHQPIFLSLYDVAS